MYMYTCRVNIVVSKDLIHYRKVYNNSHMYNIYVYNYIIVFVSLTLKISKLSFLAKYDNLAHVFRITNECKNRGKLTYKIKFRQVNFYNGYIKHINNCKCMRKHSIYLQVFP